MQNLDFKHIIDTIVRIENEFDVITLHHKGMHVWPLVRIALWTQLRHPSGNYTGKHSLKPSIRIKPESIYKDLQLAETLKGTDVVFFSRAYDYIDRFQDKYYNRHIDPLCELVRTQCTCIKLELQSVQSSTTQPRYEQTLFMSPDVTVSGRTPAHFRTYRIDGFEELKKTVSNITGSILLDETAVISQAEYIVQYRSYFENLLSIISPKALFLVCYYYPEAMALVSACRKNNITSVDVQHGKQGKYHGAYNHWTKIPAAGYECLPDIFWSWGHESANNIVQGRAPGCNHHLPVVGGNRWLGKWVEGDESKSSSEDISFCENLTQYKKLIFVSLQPIDQPVPEHLIQAILSAPPDWFWLIRPHPKQFKSKIVFHELLEKYGIKNYDIDSASRCSLYLLLKNAHHHITCWSSVCYEALALNTPTTIVHPTGYALYENYIKKGFFNYAVTPDDLISSIDNFFHDISAVRQTKYIETEKHIAQKALGTILCSKERTRHTMHSDSDNAQSALLNERGEMLFQQGRRAEAEAAFMEAARCEPLRAEAFNNLGVLHWHAGNKIEAVDYLSRALQINPDDRTAVINIGEVYQSLKQINNAEAVYARYLARHKDDAQVKELISGLSYDSVVNGDCDKKLTQAIDHNHTSTGNRQSPVTWNDILNKPCIKLYAGNIPNQKEYDSFTGLSLNRHDHRHIQHNIANTFPIPDNSVDFFQAEDVFEHVDYADLLPIINEIYRILKPGSLFRLSVPDYGCDVLIDRCIRDSNNNIVFDPGGHDSTLNTDHLWFPRIDTVKQLLKKSDFAISGKINYLHYYNMDGSFVTNKIDYTKGVVRRTPDFDERVQNPYRPMSMVIDLYKSSGQASVSSSAAAHAKQSIASPSSTHNRHYNSDYFNWQKGMGEFGGIANLFKFRDFIKPTDTVIDFGCGGGYLLNNIKAANKIGVEVNETAAEKARSFGIDVFSDIDQIEDNSADIIISSSALEHVRAPFDVLQKLYHKLKPGKLIVFVVPHDNMTIQYKPDDINQHLYTWNQMTLGNLFTQAGYNVLKVETLRHAWPPDYIDIFNKVGEVEFHKICHKHAHDINNYQIRVIATKADGSLINQPSLNPKSMKYYQPILNHASKLDLSKYDLRTLDEYYNTVNGWRHEL